MAHAAHHHAAHGRGLDAHDHDHHHPPYETAHADSKRRVRLALWLIAGFMLAEVVGGIVANSLALLADAGHMFTDVLALGLALIAFRLSERPACARHTYGRDRVQVLAAFVNGLVLLALTLWIVFEAMKRIWSPEPVAGTVVLIVGVLGLLVNIAAFAVLHGGDRNNMNLRGATLHVLSDMIGSLGAIVAAVIILLTGWTVADPLLSLLVAALILRLAWGLIHRAGLVLLQASPEDLHIPALRRELMAAVPEVEDVHHVHVWSLTTQRRVITLHARVDAAASSSTVLAAIKAHLVERHGIDHCTVQLEHGPACADEPATDPGTGAGEPGRQGGS